jgi:hypothetical protein
MKKLLMLLMLLCSMNCFAQSQNSVWWNILGFSDNSYNKKDSIGLEKATNKNLYLSGIYLKKSVSYEYGSIGLGALSGTLFIVGVHASNNNSNNHSSDKQTCYIAGSLFGVGAIVCYFISLDCRMKAGKDLKLAASPLGATLSYNF